MDVGGGTETKIQLFSEHGHVAYQIKGNDACSKMVANILPADTPSIPGGGFERSIHFFLKVVMLHIKVNGA